MDENYTYDCCEGEQTHEMILRDYLKSAKIKIECGSEVTHLITAVSVPNGTELIINTENIDKKIDYLLNAYDEKMRLKNNNEIYIKDIMIV